MCDEDDQEFPDSWYVNHISNAIAKVEEVTNVDILEHVYTGEKHDYRANDYAWYAFLQLFHLPTRSVQEVKAVYPTGQTIQIFPNEWVRLEIAHSQVQLVPTSGTIANVILGQGSDYIPFLFNGLGYLPHLWEVAYTAGMDPEKIPRSVIDVICKYAAIEMLVTISDTINPLGVTSASLSVDGLSQSRGLMPQAFKARIDKYSGDLGLPLQPGQPPVSGGMLSQLHNSYFGVNLASL